MKEDNTNWDTERRILRVKIGNVLRNFHRNSCYQEADDSEVRIAIDAICREIDDT